MEIGKRYRLAHWSLGQEFEPLYVDTEADMVYGNYVYPGGTHSRTMLPLDRPWIHVVQCVDAAYVFLTGNNRVAIYRDDQYPATVGWQRVGTIRSYSDGTVGYEALE